MSFRGLYALCNQIKDGYTVRRPDIDSIVEGDANVPATKREQTAGKHETEPRTSRMNHALSGPMELSAGGGQRSSLSQRIRRQTLGSRVLRRLFGERAEVQQDKNSQDIPRNQSQFSIHSSASRRASIRDRTERDRRRDPVVVSLNDLPPPYAHGPALPSYEIVIEEEWRRIRSLRRRTLDHANNTATSWRRPGLPPAFFDRRQREQHRGEWSRLEAHE